MSNSDGSRLSFANADGPTVHEHVEHADRAPHVEHDASTLPRARHRERGAVQPGGVLVRAPRAAGPAKGIRTLV